MATGTKMNRSPAEALAAVLARRGMVQGVEMALAAPPVASPVHRGVAHHCYRAAAPGQAPLFCKLPAADQEAMLAAAPEVRITYLMNSPPDSRMSAALVPYDRQFFAAIRDDTAEFMVSRAQVARLLDGLAAHTGNGG